MTLQQLLGYQEDDQFIRFGKRFADMSRAQRMGLVREYTLGAIHELGEAMDETGWKPWKEEGFGEVRPEAMALELADVFVFWANLVAASGVGVDGMEAAIMATLEKNRRRYDKGY